MAIAIKEDHEALTCNPLFQLISAHALIKEQYRAHYAHTKSSEIIIYLQHRQKSPKDNLSFSLRYFFLLKIKVIILMF